MIVTLSHCAYDCIYKIKVMFQSLKEILDPIVKPLSAATQCVNTQRLECKKAVVAFIDALASNPFDDMSNEHKDIGNIKALFAVFILCTIENIEYLPGKYMSEYGSYGLNGEIIRKNGANKKDVFDEKTRSELIKCRKCAQDKVNRWFNKEFKFKILDKFSTTKPKPKPKPKNTAAAANKKQTSGAAFSSHSLSPPPPHPAAAVLKKKASGAGATPSSSPPPHASQKQKQNTKQASGAATTFLSPSASPPPHTAAASATSRAFMKEDFSLCYVANDVLSEAQYTNLLKLCREVNPKVFINLSDFKDDINKDRYMCSIGVNDIKDNNTRTETKKLKRERTIFVTAVTDICADFIKEIKKTNPNHFFIAVSILKSDPNQISLQEFHFDYKLNFENEKRETDKSFSILLPLNIPANFLLRPDVRSDRTVDLVIPVFSFLKFNSRVLHAGGSNHHSEAGYRLHFYVTTKTKDIPMNEVHLKV